MSGPAPLCGLTLVGLPGTGVALGAEDLLDFCRAERADEFVLEIRGAYVDVPQRCVCPGRTALVEALFALVAQSCQAQAEAGGPRSPA